MPKPTYNVSTKDAAKILDLHESRLSQLRTAGEGPAFERVGGRFFYCRSDLITWRDMRERWLNSDHSGAIKTRTAKGISTTKLYVDDALDQPGGKESD